MRKPINIIVAALLGGLLVWIASTGPSVAQRAVGGGVPDLETGVVGGGFVDFFMKIFDPPIDRPIDPRDDPLLFPIEAGLLPNFDKNEVAKITSAHNNAVRALEQGDARTFTFNVRILDREARLQQFVRLRPEERGAFLAAQLAGDLRATLPTQFVPNVVYLRADGTVVADPDEFIRTQLRWAQESVANTAGGNGN